MQREHYSHYATHNGLTIGITTGPDYHAESIDPGSLRLDGVPVERTAQGTVAASVEALAGFAGHSLIVHFKIDGGKAASGMTIRGTVDSP